MPKILDRNLSRPDGVRWLLLSFLLTAMMAAGQEEDREEEKDAAPHSLFCERISAETGTGGQRRQRRHRPSLVGRGSRKIHRYIRAQDD
jgi:hypothetical protein